MGAREKEKYGRNENEEYHREPFAADVSEGKNDPIYNAHSYHTKVPYKAIMRYILHYTQPGDIVLDGFSGTGMTGVAANLCGQKSIVESLGYKLVGNEIFDENDNYISTIGSRKAVLNDLSSAASFIASNYNNPVNIEKFKIQFLKIVEDVEKEYGWMYETEHKENGTVKIGKINYVIWSDVFSCPHCAGEIVFLMLLLMKKVIK